MNFHSFLYGYYWLWLWKSEGWWCCCHRWGWFNIVSLSFVSPYVWMCVFNFNWLIQKKQKKNPNWLNRTHNVHYFYPFLFIFYYFYKSYLQFFNFITRFSSFFLFPLTYYFLWSETIWFHFSRHNSSRDEFSSTSLTYCLWCMPISCIRHRFEYWK